MNIKTIIFVVIISVLVGTGIFYFIRNREQRDLITIHPQAIGTSDLATPTPLPSLPPLDQNADLEEEVNNLSPRDFSTDFQNLRNSI